MTYAFEAEGLRKRFGTTQALDGVDLAAREGTVLGVLGPNGAGKTTAVRILATLLKADSGRATVGGFDVATQPHKVRQTVGLTGQYASVDEDLTGLQNLQLIGTLLNLSSRDAKARATELLEWFDLTDAGRPGRQDLLRRHAPPPRPGGQPGRPAVGDLPRRADHRPRPGQARGHVGGGPQPGHRGFDGAAHHPVPRRGRRAGRRDQRHRPRHGDRPRHPGRAQAGRSAGSASRCARPTRPGSTTSGGSSPGSPAASRSSPSRGTLLGRRGRRGRARRRPSPG